MKGAIAAGHPKTAEAGGLILEAGGNAFDAALAALCAACVAEPVLTSLGGGGFLLARTAQGEVRLYDFFVQTPQRKRPAPELDFFPITVDFGTAQQEFHIGMGSIATPGSIRGLFAVHRELGSIPLAPIVEPAIGYARDGLTVNRLQAYIFSVIAPIYLSTPGARALYASPQDPGRLYGEGETFRQADLANTLEMLAGEGERLFYEGEMGTRLARDCDAGGGHLRRSDLAAYSVVKRPVLEYGYRDARVLTNPPPSCGGLLIAFAQSLLEAFDLSAMGFGSPDHLTTLARTMAQTNLARSQVRSLDGYPNLAGLLRPDSIARYRAGVGARPVKVNGTTHISVVDGTGNAAALSLSNGEGSGYVLPGTGIMVNNMLGEEDLNPDGFHRWPGGVRVASMMAPSVALRGQEVIALGSGGSNRLRTAILQVLSNLIDFRMPAEEAVRRPRIHWERDLINVEPGFADDAVEALIREHQAHRVWGELNLFFGGTHTAAFDGQGGFAGAGDPRRGGVFLKVSNDRGCG
jgi:gamma-glutamyltranspeptidase/glutathione hydrolase